MIAADDPRHGERRGYVAGCRDTCCRAAQVRYMKRFMLDRASGKKRTVEVATFRAHLDTLLATMTAAGVAAAAGLDETTVLTMSTKTVVRLETARRILAVRPSTLTGAEQVTATGTIRRLRALSALGYGAQHLAAATGVPMQTLKDIRAGRHKRVSGRAAAKVAATYNALSMTPARGTTATDRRAISTAKTCARRNGWVPPLAWDDTTIDDPNATPEGAGYKPGYRIEQIRELEGMGLTRDAIAMRLGVTPHAIDRAIDRAARNERNAA